ncbi:MAG: energy transducer TonB [Vicinamibacterales bacterium]
MPPPASTEFYSLREIAQAADVAESVVLDLAARGSLQTASGLQDGAPLETLVSERAAIDAVRALSAGEPVGDHARSVLAVAPTTGRDTGTSLAVSTGLHGLVVLLAAAVASLGWSMQAAPPLEETVSHEPVRLVYLALPGPGGGGGGGGLKQKLPPPKAEREGDHSLASPLPARELPPPAPEPPKVEPPTPLDAKMLPPVMAPVATAPADSRNLEGVMRDTPPLPPSQGPGAGGGAGTGRGTGLGEGDGSGIGDGSGGGMGGGPYRPGSGVEPPRLLREVKATYTDEARRANITGTVDMEITIRRDGSVSDVRILRGLRGGLNERAAAAVRQWRFAPARLKGTPVDVIVEVSVEFTLR